MRLSPDELPYELTDEYLDSLNDEGMCECGQQAWEMCNCGDFFLNWVCGYNPATGSCSMAGSEDCDWECPRHPRRSQGRHP